MRDEYDFSKGKRGQFYREGAVLNLPVYLDAEVRDWITERAKAKGIEASQLVNELLRRDIALIESVK